MLQGKLAVDDAIKALIRNPGSDAAARAGRVRREIITPLRTLLAGARAYHPQTAELERLHASGVAALATEVEAFETLARAFDESDDAAIAEVARLRGQEAIQWNRWLAGVSALARAP